MLIEILNHSQPYYPKGGGDRELAVKGDVIDVTDEFAALLINDGTAEPAGRGAKRRAAEVGTVAAEETAVAEETNALEEGDEAAVLAQLAAEEAENAATDPADEASDDGDAGTAAAPAASRGRGTRSRSAKK